MEENPREQQPFSRESSPEIGEQREQRESADTDGEPVGSEDTARSRYEQNLEASAEQARELIEQRRTKNEKQALTAQLTPADEHLPASAGEGKDSDTETLDEYTPQAETVAEQLKDGATHMLYKLKGVEQPEAVHAFVSYLQSHYERTENIAKGVAPDEFEAKQHYYEQQGYEVTKEPSLDENEVLLVGEKQVPFTPTKRELQKIDALVDVKRDPISVIQQVSTLVDESFSLESILGETKSIATLCESDHTQELISFVSRLDIASDKAGFRLFEDLAALVEDDEVISLISPDMTGKLARLCTEYSVSVMLDPDNIKAAARVVEDEQLLELASDLNRQRDSSSIIDRRIDPRVLVALQESEQFDNIQFATRHISMNHIRALFDTSFAMHRSSELIDRSVRELEEALSQEPITTLLNDETLRERLSQYQMLHDSLLDEKQLERVIPLLRDHFQEVLTCGLYGMQMLGEASSLPLCEKTVQNKQLMEVIADPQMRAALVRLAELSGETLIPIQLTDRKEDGLARWVTELRDDPEFCEFLTSSESDEFDSLLEIRDMQRIDPIAGADDRMDPRIKHTLQKMRQYRDFYDRETLDLLKQYRHTFGTAFRAESEDDARHLIRDLESDATLQQTLFHENTQQVVEELSDEAKRNLAATDTVIIARCAKDDLLTPERKKFIKQYLSMNPGDLRRMGIIVQDMPDDDIQNITSILEVLEARNSTEMTANPQELKHLYTMMQREGMEANDLDEVLNLLQKHSLKNPPLTPMTLSSVQEFRDHKEELLSILDALPDQFREIVDPIFEQATLKKIAHNDLTNLFQKTISEGDTARAQFVVKHLDSIISIAPENRETYFNMLNRLFSSLSAEVRRMAEPLAEQLLQTDDPEGNLTEIEDIFVENNIPTVGKIYKVFETLYPPDRIDAILEKGDASPVLTESTTKKRYYTIYRDLLRVHVESLDPNLNVFMSILKDGEDVFAKAEHEGTESLSETEREQLEELLEKINTLYAHSLKNAMKDPMDNGNSDIELSERIARSRERLEVKDNQYIYDRLAEMFLKPIGVETFSELEHMMDAKRQEAHERGLALAERIQKGEQFISEGDLTKGVVGDQMPSVLSHGFVAREYLGQNAGSDATPLDADVARVPEKKETIHDTIRQLMSRGYGDTMIYIKDRGQFQKTRGVDADASEEPTYDKDRLELFGTSGGQHYGIRTGFPSSEIDALICEPNAASLGQTMYTIAENGFYIPVVDEEGTLLFTPDMYERYRQAFQGLERFNGDPLHVEEPSEEWHRQQIEQIVDTKREENRRIEAVTHSIRSAVEKALEEHGVSLQSPYDTSLRGAKLSNTGSSDRGVNVPGDLDFDFSLQLDENDVQHAGSIANAIRSTMNAHTFFGHAEAQYEQIRAGGVTQIGDTELETPVDIDIGVSKKVAHDLYESHDALDEKMNWITHHYGEETLETVRANIVLAKQVLKKGGVYKKGRHEFGEGGLGGIGVENWILQHNGNMINAFRAFVDAAHEDGERVPLHRFRERYALWDPGVNIKHGEHDNFVNRLDNDSYHRMLDVCEQHI